MKDLNCLVECEGSKGVPRGIVTSIDVPRFVLAAMDSNLPPWRPIPSRSVAKLLGIKLQTLANWRMRDIGRNPSRGRREAATESTIAPIVWPNGFRAGGFPTGNFPVNGFSGRG